MSLAERSSLFDTVFALSTIAGRSGVAVIRVSGPKAMNVLKDLGMKREVEARIATYLPIISPFSKEVIDEAIVIYFKGPKSFTGEDIVEIQTHGSIAVINELMETLGQFSYLRIAEPGEFSKKAFLNGRIDLTAAEGLADLIDAETAMQKRVALRQMNGELENLYEQWRAEIVTILAQLEAFIDFPDDDIPQDILKFAEQKILDLSEKMAIHLNDNNRGEVIMRGVQVAIIGQPNVGKSSLINAIAKKEVAIVSDIAGTTRDVIDVKIDLAGFPVIFYDTAGIRDADDVIEKEGVRRALKIQGDADITIYVVDQADPKSLEAIHPQTYNPEKSIVVINKSDLGECLFNSDITKNAIKISAKTQQGFSEMLERLLVIIKDNYMPSSDPVITRVRYRNYIQSTMESLTNFSLEMPLDMATEEIRCAANYLGKITGKIDIEEVLDEIFSTFCIGK